MSPLSGGGGGEGGEKVDTDLNTSSTAGWFQSENMPTISSLVHMHAMLASIYATVSTEDMPPARDESRAATIMKSPAST